MAGLAASRARGRVGGRRPALNAAQLAHAEALAAAGTPVREMAELLRVGPLDAVPRSARPRARHRSFSGKSPGQLVSIGLVRLRRNVTRRAYD